MKKKTIITLLLTLIAVVGQSQENNTSYTFKGDVREIIKDMANDGVTLETYFLVDYASKEPITKKQACKDSVISISGKTDAPRLVQLCLEMKIPGGIRTKSFPFILEAGDIVFTIDTRTFSVGGTPRNDALFKAVNELREAYKADDFEKVRQIPKDYILQHKDDVSAILMLTINGKPDTADEAAEQLALIEQCGDVVRQHPVIIKSIEDANTVLSRPKEGDMFKDFAIDYDGQTHRLSDYVGRGKYALVDFWASWCGPCRREIPNLISLYEKYKNRNFTIVGVAVNDKPEATLKAIAQDSIPYPQILNTQNVAPSLYGFDGIPYIILIAPEGRILGTGLRGENINRKLSEIFGE